MEQYKREFIEFMIDCRSDIENPLESLDFSMF